MRGRVAGRKPSKMIRSKSSGMRVRAVFAGVTPYSSVFGRYESAVSRYGSPSPTSRTRRSRSGGTTAHARSSSPSASASRARPSGTSRTSITAAPRGTSSMITSVRVCGSSSLQVARLDEESSAYSSSRRCAGSMSRFGDAHEDDRVTPDGAGRTPGATIAWLRRSRPTWMHPDLVIEVASSA